MTETELLYVDPGHRVPDPEWAEVVRRAQELREAAEAAKTGGASSPAGRVIDMRGRSNKHSGVSGIPTQLLVLHSAECPLRGGYAQSLTEWAITSDVIASWQRFIDPISRVYMIDDMYAAWHASEANPMSIGWEQAGYARYSRAEWTTPDGMLQMESLAYDMAQVALRDGIPPVWLTTEQVTAITTYGDRATKGFCCHRQIDPESRTDPGNGYPYDLLMQKIRTYMGSGPETEDDMGFDPGAQWYTDMVNAQARIDRKVADVYDRVFGRDVQRWYHPDTLEVSFDYREGWLAARSTDIHDIVSTNNLIVAQTDKVLDAVSKIPGVDASVIAGLREQLAEELKEATDNLKVTLVVENPAEEKLLEVPK